MSCGFWFLDLVCLHFTAALQGMNLIRGPRQPPHPHPLLPSPPPTATSSTFKYDLDNKQALLRRHATLALGRSDALNQTLEAPEMAPASNSGAMAKLLAHSSRSALLVNARPAPCSRHSSEPAKPLEKRSHYYCCFNICALAKGHKFCFYSTLVLI